MERTSPARSSTLGVAAAVALVAALSIIPAQSALAADYTATDLASLNTALASAVPGDTVLVDGEIVGNVTVDEAITLTAAPGGGTLTGTVRLEAPATVEGLTLQANAASGSTGSAVIVTATAAGATIQDNTIRNGSNLISITGVSSALTPGSPVVTIEGNAFSAFATPSQDNAIWISNSRLIDVLGNTFTNDGTSVAINLAGGSSYITIDGNTISGVANAVVMIANGANPSLGVTISDNRISGVPYALFFGGENIEDLEVTGNAISGATGSAISVGSTAWDSGTGAPITGVQFTDNTVSNSTTGILFTATATIAPAGILVDASNTFRGVDRLVQDPDGEVGAGNVTILARVSPAVPGEADFTG